MNLKNQEGWPLFAVQALAPIPLFLSIYAAILTMASPLNALQLFNIQGLLTDASTVLFTLVLACTPLTIMFGWRWTQRLKKPLALYAFMYGMLHFIVFSSGFNFGFWATLENATANAMLLTGTLALFLMIPLAITSNRWSMKLLKKNWKRLHYLTYVIAILLMLHVLFLGQGIILVPLYTLLLVVRLPQVRKTIIGWRTGKIANPLMALMPQPNNHQGNT